MSALLMELETTLCKARGIVRIAMDNLGTGRGLDEDIEYALWTVSDLLSNAIELLDEPPEWPILGQDELAVQDEGGIVHFDKIFPEDDGPELHVTPDGAVVTTKEL